MITRPVVRSVIRQTIRSAIAGLVQRFFSTLDGLATSYTMPTWTATGDFAVPFKFALVGAPANETILGETSSIANSLKVTNSTTITAVVNSVSIPFTVPAVGTLYHSGIIRRVGSVLSLDLDATTYNNATASTGSFTLTKLGVSNGVDFGSMTLADVGLEDTAGSDKRFYPLDSERSGAGAYELDSLATLGAELYAFSDLGTDGSAVLVETSSGFTFDGTSDVPQNSERCYLNLATEIGKTYKADFTQVSAPQLGTVFARAGANGTGTILNTGDFLQGHVSFTATSATSSLLFDGGTGVEVYEFSEVSVREAPNALQKVNFFAEDVERFTLNTATDPDQWENADKTRILVVAS